MDLPMYSQCPEIYDHSQTITAINGVKVAKLNTMTNIVQGTSD